MAGLTAKQWEEVEKRLKKIDAMEISLIKGNGTKSLSQRVDILEKTPPKFSGKQVVANAILVITAIGLLGGFQFFSLDNIGRKIEQVESKVDFHIAAAVKPNP